jgi:hypothetical protein
MATSMGRDMGMGMKTGMKIEMTMAASASGRHRKCHAASAARTVRLLGRWLTGLKEFAVSATRVAGGLGEFAGGLK